MESTILDSIFFFVNVKEKRWTISNIEINNDFLYYLTYY